MSSQSLAQGVSLTPEEIVGYRIRQARERMGATQQQIGEALRDYLPKPWPRQAVYAAELGRRSFTAAEILALAQVLSVDPGRLFAPPVEVAEVSMPNGLAVPVEELSRRVLDGLADVSAQHAVEVRELVRRVALVASSAGRDLQQVRDFADRIFD
jgi:transcriptional regulator with XRE-family HTH domain